MARVQVKRRRTWEIEASLLTMKLLAIVSLLLAVSSVTGQLPGYSSREDPNVDDPVITFVEGRRTLVFPDDARIPRFETDTEREYLSNRSQGAASSQGNRKLQQGPNSCACGFDSFCCSDWDDSCQVCEFGWSTQFGCPAGGCPDGPEPFATPRGSIFTPGEYEPNEGILLAYEGPNSWLNIVAQMAAAVTTEGGVNGQNEGGIVRLAVSSSLQGAATNKLNSFGADLSKVIFQVYNADTIWIRDYGPRFTYENGVRVMVDHLYNRFSRLQDNRQPEDFADQYNVKRYLIGDENTGALVHGGGNYHLDSSEGIALSTDLILDENPPKSTTEVIGLWQAFQNLTTDITAAFPANVDATQHIDMWLISIGPKKLIISDHRLDTNTIQYSITNNVANMYTAMGYEVFRTPAENSGFNGANGVHYTYTNAVIVNKIVLVPIFSQAQSGWDAESKEVWETAMGSEYKIVQIQSQAIVTAAGVLHCICMHVPAFDYGSGRTAPLVSITSTVEEVLSEGRVFFVYDDDKFEVSSLSIQVLVGGNEIFSSNLNVGVFSFNFNSMTTASIQGNSGSFDIVVCVEDEDGESDCDNLIGTPSILSPPATPPGCPETTPTGDDLLNINDVLVVLTFIVDGGDSSDPCFLQTLDFNNSGNIDVSDVIAIVDVIVG